MTKTQTTEPDTEARSVAVQKLRERVSDYTWSARETIAGVPVDIALFKSSIDARIFQTAIANLATTQRGLTLAITEAQLRSLRSFAISRAWFEVPVTNVYETLRLVSSDNGNKLVVYKGKRLGLKVVAPSNQAGARALLEEWCECGRAS